MKEKGFTLVELLAVIIIIGLLATLVLPQVLNQFNNHAKELSEDTKKMLEESVFVYLQENAGKYQGKNACVRVETLVSDGAITESLASKVCEDYKNVSCSVSYDYRGASPKSIEYKKDGC